MARFMHYDENEDGTITFRTNILVEGEETTAVVPMSFDEFLTSMIPCVNLDEAETFASKNVVRIPNDIEGA